MAKTSNTKGKIIFGILLLGALVTGGILLSKKLKAQNQKQQDAANAQTKATALKAKGDPGAAAAQAEATAIANTPDGFPLQFGSTDAKTSGAVSKMQSWLLTKDANALPIYGVDGKFGNETKAAVAKYIDPSGTVSQDWYNANVVGSAAASAPVTDSWIGKTVYAAYDGVTVFNYSAGQGATGTYKMAAKNEWLGTITSQNAQDDSMWVLDNIRTVNKDAVKLSQLGFDGGGKHKKHKFVGGRYGTDSAFRGMLN